MKECKADTSEKKREKETWSKKEVHLSIHPSISLSLPLFYPPSVHKSIHSSFYSSTHLSMQSLNPFILQSIHSSIYSFIHPLSFLFQILTCLSQLLNRTLITVALYGITSVAASPKNSKRYKDLQPV